MNPDFEPDWRDWLLSAGISLVSCIIVIYT